MRYLLDTNICIYLIKNRPPSLRSRFDKLRVGDVAVSAITCCELQFGVANSARPAANEAALAQFLAPLLVLDFPASASDIYGRIRAALQKAGRPIGNYDLLLAAHAMALDLTLVSNNAKEFSRVKGLKLENWT